jgi:hypothetical protein
MRRVLESLIGVERVKEAGHLKPGNAEAVVVFIPNKQPNLTSHPCGFLPLSAIFK